MALDFMAARAVARAKLLERAVHDPGPWEIRVGDETSQAVKVRTASRLIFLAHFSSLDKLEDVAWLSCRGELLNSLDIQAPAGGPFSIEWEFEMDERVEV